ncbi:MAG: diaminopimelate epimerase [Clostridia bacterium]|nr:diaminopimelate epimerase [Clostridia bacterium]
MKLEFTKMQACGNDYIYVNCLKNRLKNPSQIAKILSVRRFSVGADGLVLILPDQKADFKLEMYNADGSLGKTCGNALRCVAKYLFERGYTDKTRLKISSSGVIYRADMLVSGKKVVTSRVNFAVASFSPDDIPVLAREPIINKSVEIDGKMLLITCVSVGNPHAVIFCEHPFAVGNLKMGETLERASMFPQRTNVEFVKVIDRQNLTALVWERGSGRTLSCGSGACAIGAVAVKLGLADFDTPLNVKMEGGTLTVTVAKDYSVRLDGDCKIVYDGVAYVED